MNSDLYQTLTMIATQICLGIYVVLLVEFRQPKRVWLLSLDRHGLWFGGASGRADRSYRISFVSRNQMLTLVAPYTLGTVWCSQYRKMGTVFSVANGAYVGCVGALNGFVAQVLFPTIPFLALWVRIVSMILLYLVLKRFGQTYRQMVRQLDHGWTLICLIPIATSKLTLYIFNTYFHSDPFPASVAMYGLLVVCGCAYYLMYLFFERVEKETEARHDSAAVCSATLRTEKQDGCRGGRREHNPYRASRLAP